MSRPIYTNTIYKVCIIHMKSLICFCHAANKWNLISDFILCMKYKIIWNTYCTSILIICWSCVGPTQICFGGSFPDSDPAFGGSFLDSEPAYWLSTYSYSTSTPVGRVLRFSGSWSFWTTLHWTCSSLSLREQEPPIFCRNW